MSVHLSDTEIADITKPLTQGAARIRYLRRLGIKVEPKPNGQPLVWRSDFEAARRRAGEAANDTPARRDWSNLEKKVRYGRGEKAERRQPARA